MWSFVKLIFLSNNWILIRVLIKSFPKLFFMCLFMLLLLQSRLMMHFIHLIILVLRLIIKKLSYLFFFETAVPESSQTDESNARPKRAGKAPWYLADYHCPFVDTPSFTLFPIFTTNHFASVINTFWKRQVVREADSLGGLRFSVPYRWICLLNQCIPMMLLVFRIIGSVDSSSFFQVLKSSLVSSSIAVLNPSSCFSVKIVSVSCFFLLFAFFHCVIIGDRASSLRNKFMVRGGWS